MTASRNGKGRGKTPRSQPKVPEPPGDLQAAGRRTWALLWSPELPQIRWPHDEPLVTRLARLEDEMSVLRRQLLEEGAVLQKPIQTAGGRKIGTEPFVHPAMLALRRLGAEAGDLCSALGIGAHSRHNLGIAEPRPPDFVDELKERRRKRRVAMGAVG